MVAHGVDVTDEFAVGDFYRATPVSRSMAGTSSHWLTSLRTGKPGTTPRSRFTTGRLRVRHLTDSGLQPGDAAVCHE